MNTEQERAYRDIRKAVMDVITDVYDRAAQIDVATDEVIDLVSAALQSQDREDAALAEILREAASIIEAIHPEFPPRNMRRPIVDELEGFALMLDHARRIEGDGE